MELKKYKLQDLVANGSNVRRKISSDVLIGDTDAGYGLGDILDANATSQLVEQKVADLHIENINETIAAEVSSLKEKDIVHDERIEQLDDNILDLKNSIETSINGSLDHLTISIFQNV